MNHLRLCCLALCVLLACACARQPATLPPEQADAVWQRYLAAASPALPAASRYQLSLRFGREGDSRRVTALMWGNGNGPLRLDIMAGVGVSVAKIMETETDFLIYAPHEGRAYSHEGPQKPLLKVGLPIPLQLSHVFSLLDGEYAALFGERHGKAALDGEGVPSFQLLDGPLTGSLSLRNDGLPSLWKQDGGRGWTMRILYTDDARPLPRRMELHHADGHEAVLLVKSREHPDVPFPEERLRLPLPEGTPVLPLSQYRDLRSR